MTRVPVKHLSPSHLWLARDGGLAHRFVIVRRDDDGTWLLPACLVQRGALTMLTWLKETGWSDRVRRPKCMKCLSAQKQNKGKGR